MTRLSLAKLATAALGLALWGAGVRLADDRLTWAGVGLLACAFLLRFLNRRPEQ